MPLTGRQFTLAEIAEKIGGKSLGDLQASVNTVDTLLDATPDSLSFFSSAQYQSDLKTTRAGIVILNKAGSDSYSGNRIIVENPHLGFAKAASILFPSQPLQKGTHPSAFVSPSASISDQAEIAAGAKIGAGTRIERGVVVGPNCVIGNKVSIDKGTRIDAQVSIYDETQIGQNCHIQSGAVVGSDGFGFAKDDGAGGWLKVPQLGRVLIGNSVHIGANTCVDRGSIGDTILADGVIIDNLVQIAHNVKIGEQTAIAGCVAIAGSTRIGANCLIAGRAAIVGHLNICDGVQVNADSLVTKSIQEPGIYTASWPAMPLKRWRHLLAEMRRQFR